MSANFSDLLTQKIGPAAPGIIAILTLALGEQWAGYAIAALYVYAAWIDPLVPPPSSTSPVLYRRLYPLLQQLCGNTGYNSNHCDRCGKQTCPKTAQSPASMEEK